MVEIGPESTSLVTNSCVSHLHRHRTTVFLKTKPFHRIYLADPEVSVTGLELFATEHLYLVTEKTMINTDLTQAY